MPDPKCGTETQFEEKMVSIIVAVAENGTIGDRNALLWHISEDLKRFKALTTGHPVIMGRKTYESLGRPLPNRTNVVLSRSGGEFPGCRVARSLDEALALFPDDEELFIIRAGPAAGRPPLPDAGLPPLRGRHLLPGVGCVGVAPRLVGVSPLGAGVSPSLRLRTLGAPPPWTAVGGAVCSAGR